jgi:hypothetical protein
MDYYGVKVLGSAIPNGQTPQEYLEHIRTNLNSYVLVRETEPGLLWVLPREIRGLGQVVERSAGIGSLD